MMNTKSINTMLLTLIILTVIYWVFTDNNIKEYFITNSNNIIMGRYIKLQQTQTSYEDFAEIQVFSQKDGSNIITPNTRVTASSTPSLSLGMSNLVDNNLTTYAHTDTNRREWIEIDLGKMVPIYQINLHNRIDCCYGRATGVELLILDQNKSTIYVSNKIADKSGSTINKLANRDIKYNLNKNIPNTTTWAKFVYFPPNRNVYGYNLSDVLPTMPPSSL